MQLIVGMATWNGLKRPSRVIVSVAGLVLTVAATAEGFGYALRSIESGRPATFASRGHGRPVRLVDAPRRKIAHCVSVCCLPALQPRNPSPVKTVYRRSVLFSFLFSALTLSLFGSPPASADASKVLNLSHPKLLICRAYYNLSKFRKSMSPWNMWSFFEVNTLREDYIYV